MLIVFMKTLVSVFHVFFDCFTPSFHLHVSIFYIKLNLSIVSIFLFFSFLFSSPRRFCFACSNICHLFITYSNQFDHKIQRMGIGQ